MTDSERYHHLEYLSPLGSLWGAITPEGKLAALYFDTLPAALLRRKDEITAASALTAQALTNQLTEYFQGKRQRFTLPLMPGGTSFQQRIWGAIGHVKYGEVSTYARLAAEAGSPRAFQSAGTATGKNPISIIIPCHRILPDSLFHKQQKHPGSLSKAGNYAGGVERKHYLLQLEGVLAPTVPELPF